LLVLFVDGLHNGNNVARPREFDEDKILAAVRDLFWRQCEARPYKNRQSRGGATDVSEFVRRLGQGFWETYPSLAGTRIPFHWPMLRFK
jgi:hypothetical protein